MSGEEFHPRRILVSIEMELEEGEHFNHKLLPIDDLQARFLAEASFMGILEHEDTLLDEWVESRIISPATLGCGCLEYEHPNTVEAMKTAHPEIIGWPREGSSFYLLHNNNTGLLK